jgi:carbamoyl-phosphate synthase large subunit
VPELLSGPTRRVLVTGAGGPAAVAFMRSVAERDVELLAADIDPCAAGLYLVPGDRRHLILRGDDPRLVDVLLELCERERVEALVPTVDTELLPIARRRADFEAIGTRVLAPTVEALELCLDKWVLIEACTGSVDVPRTVLYDDGFDPLTWAWPAIVKPRQGSGSRGVTLVDGPGGLAGIPKDGSNVVQQLLPGLEHSIDVLAYRDGRVAAAVPRTRLKVDSGIAVAGCSERSDVLEAFGKAAAARIGLTCVANVQVRQDADGVPRLLEINPRFPGSMPLTVASGVDMPVLALADLFDEAVPDTVEHRALGMVRHWEEVFFDPGEMEVRP